MDDFAVNYYTQTDEGYCLNDGRSSNQMAGSAVLHPIRWRVAAVGGASWAGLKGRFGALGFQLVRAEPMRDKGLKANSVQLKAF